MVMLVFLWFFFFVCAFARRRKTIHSYIFILRNIFSELWIHLQMNDTKSLKLIQFSFAFGLTRPNLNPSHRGDSLSHVCVRKPEACMSYDLYAFTWFTANAIITIIIDGAAARHSIEIWFFFCCRCRLLLLSYDPSCISSGWLRPSQSVLRELNQTDDTEEQQQKKRKPNPSRCETIIQIHETNACRWYIEDELKSKYEIFAH